MKKSGGERQWVGCRWEKEWSGREGGGDKRRKKREAMKGVFLCGGGGGRDFAEGEIQVGCVLTFLLLRKKTIATRPVYKKQKKSYKAKKKSERTNKMRVF